MRGGGEALAHTARRYLENLSTDKAFVKLDFENAFNSVRLDAVLEVVARLRPYLVPSFLWTGDSCLESAEGVQQGDPLGPLLLCLPLDAPLKGLHCELVSGYLDDVGIGDSVPNLITQLRQFDSAAALIGLRLNHAKCEVIGLSADQKPIWDSSGYKFLVTRMEDASLLGAPLTLPGTDVALRRSRNQLEWVSKRLLRMPAHEAFFL